MKYIIKNTVFVILGALLLNACTPMDHYYKDLIALGDQVYAGKADSVRALPGRNRLKVVWKNPSDPSVSQTRVYWSNFQDSVMAPIDHQVDTGFVILDNMAEGLYNLTLITFDASGNRSLPVELNGEVFGDRFQASLRNRDIRQVEMLEDSVTVFWYEDFSETMLYTELNYINLDGESKQVFFASDSVRVGIPRIDIRKEISFKTFFLPDFSALDTFMTAYNQADLRDYQLRALTLKGVGSSTADFINFASVLVRNYDQAATRPENIDLAHLRGSSSAHNFIVMTNSAGFGAFTASLRDNIASWSTRNHGLLVNLGDAVEYQQMYESLDEKDRAAMKAAFDNAAAEIDPVGRLTQIAAGDIIAFHSVDRDIYVIIKVISADSASDLNIEFKISTP